MRQSTLKNTLQTLASLADIDPSARAQVSATAPGPLDAELLLRGFAVQLERVPLKLLRAQDLLHAARTQVEVAEYLTRLPVDVPHRLAVAACLWLDVGKAALDACDPSGYSVAADAPGPTAAAALEAEAETHGADHALAGKWLAERWALPTAVCEAIWLHHHTTSTIALAAESPRLCYFVQLCDALAEFRRTGASPATTPWIEELCKRLGLRAKEALSAARATPRESRPTEAPATINAFASTEQRLAAVCAMHEALHAAEKEDDILLAVAVALRNAFDAPCGILRTQHTSVRWDERSAPAIVLADADLPPSLESSVRAVATPLSHAGEAHGHAWITLPQNSTPVAAQLAHVMTILDAGAAVLGKRARAAQSDTRGEALARALHAAEASRQQAQQTQQLRGLARFAAGAAHEINNPLAVISGRAQLLLSQSATPGQESALETIVQQSRRIQKIVSDLMQFARPPEPMWTVIDIAQIVEPLAAAERERLEARQISVSTHYGQGLPRVRVDRHQVEQAIGQGLLNAAQALGEGPGAIVLAVTTNAAGDALEISIRDNGPGIAVDHLDKVFDPFFTTRQFQEGSTGLGLTVCRSIIEAHGGQVRLSSRAGEGTVLSMALPAAVGDTSESQRGAERREQLHPPAAPPGDALDAETGIVVQETRALREPAVFPMQRREAPPAERLSPESTPSPAITAEAAAQAEAIVERVFPRLQPARATAAPPAIVPAQGRILLVEENEDLREILRAALASRGYETETAPDGLEGLANALAHPPDLVICGTQLSGVDALTLIRQVRQRNAKTPVIALAGPGPDEIAAEVLQAGARALLHKPFEFDRLLQEITHFLAARSVA